jgi:ribosome maturation factor RimP
MANEMTDRLTDLLKPAAETHGLELVLLEMSGAQRSPLVRIYLDREGGIAIDHIAMANKWIKELLDPLPELARGYTLEVSSPGIERPLVTLRHFERFVGSDAVVTVDPDIDGRRRFTGTIAGVEGTTIALDVDGTTIRVPFCSVTKARLRAVFDFGKEGT